LFSDSGILQRVEFVRDGRSCTGTVPWQAKCIVDYCKAANTDLSVLKYERDGTAHQRAVWDFLLTIPKGQTRTYSEVSQAVGGSPHSVANALRRNPLPVLFPCHRVVAKSGIGGFSGETKGGMISIKKHLLAIEAA